MEYKFVLKVEADSEGEAEEKLSEWSLEKIKDNLVCEDEIEEQKDRSCDECHIGMTEREYKKNKGLCDVCIRNIN